MEKLTTCKACGKPVSRSAKRCPNCGKKLKHPFFNFIVTILAIVALVNTLNDFTSDSNSSEEKEQSALPTEQEKLIDVTVDELITHLDENALRASRTYKNSKVRLTGTLSTIDSNGRYFSLGPLRGFSILDDVTCKIDDTHLDVVSRLVKGQTLIVEGEIILVGELLGYTIDVSTIKEITNVPDVVWNEQAVKSTEQTTKPIPNSSQETIDTVKDEGSSNSESVYGADNDITNWNEQAVKKAQFYLDTMPFSKFGLIEQLEYEGFSYKEAQFGVDHLDIDWNEQAIKKAQFYLDTMPFSKSRLIEQLEYEGFTHDQAVYGVNTVGQ